MINILQNLSILTEIPEKYLTKLNDKIIYCISDAIYEENILQGKQVIELNIGIGIICLQFIDNELKYKFIPNEELNLAIKDTIINRQNMLENKLEKSLINKFTSIYKDILC